MRAGHEGTAGPMLALVGGRGHDAGAGLQLPADSNPPMAAHTEIELKWAVDGHGHRILAERLGQDLGPARSLEQENRFFDSADLRLRSAGLNVRLRREADQVLLTCKRRLPGKDGAHCHEEWEHWLGSAIWPTLDETGLASRLPLPGHIRAVLDGVALHALGGFSNQRLEFRHGHELLCLDRTDFRQRVDFELEIETAEPAGSARYWGNRLRHWGVAYRDEPVSKFARFLALQAPGARG